MFEKWAYDTPTEAIGLGGAQLSRAASSYRGEAEMKGSGADVELSLLSQELERLEVVLSQHVDRLMSVLGPDTPPTTSQTAPGGCAPVVSPMAARIRSLADRVRGMSAAVAGVTSRIDL